MNSLKQLIYDEAATRKLLLAIIDEQKANCDKMTAQIKALKIRKKNPPTDREPPTDFQI